MLYTFDGEVNVDGIVVVMKAEAEGYYKEGDAFGYGCEPPDEDFEITDTEFIRAYNEETEEKVELTEELCKKAEENLKQEDFVESDYEPDHCEGDYDC